MKKIFLVHGIIILLLSASAILLKAQSIYYYEKGGHKTTQNLVDRNFVINDFNNPPLIFRPMPIINGTINKSMIYNFKQLGYGGVVTNVSYNDYLQSNKKWSEFEDLTKYIIDTLGQHMWIYDELHYPSGAAGGLVLKDNSEWQAKGIVCLTTMSKGTEVLKIEKPYGHLKVIAANAYKGTSLNDIDYSTCVNISEFLDSNGNLAWAAPEKGWLAVCIYSKNFFEGTHATFSWGQTRRYIDLLRKEPVQKFIDITYKQYFDNVGKYFGKGIDAFFTDEPSLMGTYFVYPPPVKPAILDTPDTKIPLLPTVNFGDQVLSQFKIKRGYDLNRFLPMLFGGDSEQAQRLRWDYYKTLSELVSEDYMGQIGNFCSSHNIALSGHILFEEDIKDHPIFEGDFLQIYKNMQYPGIDLLTSHPETALDWACTAAKMASSAAHYSNRLHVMSEVSDAFDEQKGDVNGRLGAIAVQYALGVDHINSYYGVNKMNKEENELFTSTIGRFGYMLDRGKHIARIAVYYPIEGIWTQTLPPENLYTFNSKVKEISKNFKELSLQLLTNQLDYDYLNDVNLAGCTVSDGKIMTPSGEQYSVFIMPQTPTIDSKTIDFLLKAANQGVKIIIQNSKSVITENGSNKDAMIEKYTKLIDHENSKLCSSINDVISEVEKANIRDIKLGSSNSKVIYLKKQFANSCVYMLVNVSNSELTIDATFNLYSKNIKIWDPFTDKVQKVEKVNSDDENLMLYGIKVGAGKAIFITFE